MYYGGILLLYTSSVNLVNLFLVEIINRAVYAKKGLCLYFMQQVHFEADVEIVCLIRQVQDYHLVKVKWWKR